MRITDAHLDHLVKHGFVLVPDFLTREEIIGARENMLRYVPTPEELAATPERYPWIFEEGDRLQTEFPFVGDALNNVATHPELISFVERAMNTRQVVLSQSAIWAKYAGAGDFEQALHLDYEGNTLVVPRDDGDYRQVNMILYYTDVTDDMAPTCVVPAEKSADLPIWPTFRSRKMSPQLYRHERRMIAGAGSLLIFGMKTWHRASAMDADFGARFSHHMIWRSVAHGFQGFHQWSQFGEKPEFKRFIEHSTPRQRETLGFPTPQDPYWTADTIAAVAMRYPKMDMKPYRTAIKAVSSH
ncbi:MAG TPA: phytanoyl-CoA dioxygenase family protein [Tepidisphaeraceae bacterium]|nr:phytanoyl-CoA dioxygenase family protein [Tepidisphaeraceae bacterium]